MRTLIQSIVSEYLNEQMKYPLAHKDKWYGDSDYKIRGGKMIYMTPDEFLSKAKELEIDDEARDNIDYLKNHIKQGGELDPLALYSPDKSKTSNSDGRHRAIASKELGIELIPVVIFY